MVLELSLTPAMGQVRCRKLEIATVLESTLMATLEGLESMNPMLVSQFLKVILRILEQLMAYMTGRRTVTSLLMADTRQLLTFQRSVRQQMLSLKMEEVTSMLQLKSLRVASR